MILMMWMMQAKQWMMMMIWMMMQAKQTQINDIL